MPEEVRGLKDTFDPEATVGRLIDAGVDAMNDAAPAIEAAQTVGGVAADMVPFWGTYRALERGDVAGVMMSAKIDRVQIMAKRARPGDVLEIAAPDGWIYAHYLGKHPEYGDAIAVCPTKHAERAPIRSELFGESYVAFYPAVAAVNRGLAAVVGHLPAPGLPTRLRRAGARNGRKVETWIIEDRSRETLKESLSDEERELPIAAIWNHEMLMLRVSNGWRPSIEGREEDDRSAIVQARQTSGPAAPRAVSHYLYFPGERAAAEAAAELQSLGFKTEERLDPEGTNWLVLARQESAPSEDVFAATCDVIANLARGRGGEYDGWEIELPP
ncbi:MAG TPA: ribonuclease E inhibitor RraB [Kofleriaceae bacterium]|jgi:hypothetical protein|nr:ribonuclease E inhibitor RraB [Kofleriaceae bacterium]